MNVIGPTNIHILHLAKVVLHKSTIFLFKFVSHFIT